MAIISIPTSIGGVSIPGNLINGPLGALFGNKFGVNNYQYPRDLGSATKGHVVQFSINETDPLTYEEISQYVTDNFSSKRTQTPQQTADDLKEKFNSVKEFFTGGTQKTLNFRRKRNRIVANISLYIPDTINFQYNVNYPETTLLDVGASFFPLLSAVQGNAARLALSTQGLAINPQQQLLFQGINFRTYQMAFTFTPYSRQEAETVKEIIKLFRYHSAPQITTAAAGMFFVPPSTFNLDFFFNGQRNPNITKVTESVIESIDVNYTPNGMWAAHDDGASVQTTLTINFKEIDLIDKDKIQAGY